jgi:hypothetical protein
VIQTLNNTADCLEELRLAVLDLPKSDLIGLVKNKQAEECFANETYKLNEFVERFNKLNNLIFNGQSLQTWADVRKNSIVD